MFSFIKASAAPLLATLLAGRSAQMWSVLRNLAVCVIFPKEWLML